MHQKFYYSQIDENVYKYEFKIHNYFLPEFFQIHSKEPNKVKYVLTEDEKLPRQSKEVVKDVDKLTALEPFKIKKILSTKPSVCTWEFMTEREILEMKEIKKMSTLRKTIAGKLEQLKLKGLPRKLLVELFVSGVKFCNKYSMEPNQTGSLLSILYNIHVYFSHNLWMTAEEIYNLFKEYIYFNCINLPPYRTKIFEIKECKKIMLYFCSIYIRNLPLIRMLMLPNYGLLFNTKLDPEAELLKSDKKGKKGKKGDKKKK